MASKIKEILIKPKWLHKDPVVRAQAVAASNDPRLVASLPEYARQDPDAGVRLRAAKRLTDMYYLMRLASDDADTAVREYAYRTYRSMLAGLHPHAPPLAQRLEIVPKLDDEALIEFLATAANEPEIRGAAQAKIQRQGLLGDIALSEPDPQLRRAVAERIDQLSTLERVAQFARRTDKQLFRTLVQRMDEMRIAGGDAATLERVASALCENLEALVRRALPADEKRQDLERIQTQWDELPAKSAATQSRYEGARYIVEQALSPTTPSPQPIAPSTVEKQVAAFIKTATLDPQPELSTVLQWLEQAARWRQQASEISAESLAALQQSVDRLSELRHELLAQQPVSPALLQLCEKLERTNSERPRKKELERIERDWKHAWKGLQMPNPSEHALQQRFNQTLDRRLTAWQEQEDRREQAIDGLDENLQRLRDALDAGDLAASLQAQTEILATLSLVGHHAKVDSSDFKGRLHRLRGRLAELRDWQRWANDKVRLQLCEEAEALCESGLHPDAIAEKAKLLNGQWRDLEQSERLPGDDPKKPAAPGLRRRFQSACNRAFLPIKPYFEKRAELRDQRLHKLEQLAEQLKAAVDDTEYTDPKQLERLIRTGRGSLRELRGIPAAKRGSISRQLRAGADALDERLEAHYQIAERKKRRIIEEVMALGEETDLAQAIAAAKEAQRHWQATGNTRRHREQQLWREFRAASDAIFTRLDAQRNSERDAREAQRSQLLQLIDELTAVLTGTHETLLKAVHELDRMQDRWREVGLDDRKLEARFRQLISEVQTAAQAAQAAEEETKRQQVLALATTCQQMERIVLDGKSDPELLERLTEQRANLPANMLTKSLNRRIEGIVTAATDSDALAQLASIAEGKLAEGLELCIAMEFLAGIESPTTYKQARMDYQVKRLSERMSGGVTRSAQDEARDLEAAWLACGPLPATDVERIGERFLNALAAFGDSH